MMYQEVITKKNWCNAYSEYSKSKVKMIKDPLMMLGSGSSDEDDIDDPSQSAREANVSKTREEVSVGTKESVQTDSPVFKKRRMNNKSALESSKGPDKLKSIDSETFKCKSEVKDKISKNINTEFEDPWIKKEGKFSELIEEKKVVKEESSMKKESDLIDQIFDSQKSNLIDQIFDDQKRSGKNSKILKDKKGSLVKSKSKDQPAETQRKVLDFFKKI